jgi:hypothetical protein
MAKAQAEALALAVKAEEEKVQAEARAAVLARQRMAVAEQSRLLAEEREREEAALLDLEQRNLQAEESLAEARRQRLEAEREAVVAAEQRVEAEQQATEAARQRGLAELLERQAAKEKAELQEQLIATLQTSEELERGLIRETSEELRHAKAQMETGMLLQKLRKTHRINRFSQVALAASLLLSVGLWMNGSGQRTTAVENVASGNVAAVQVAPEPKQDEAARLASLRLTTDLGDKSAQKPQREVEKEF